MLPCQAFRTRPASGWGTHFGRLVSHGRSSGPMQMSSGRAAPSPGSQAPPRSIPGANLLSPRACPGTNGGGVFIAMFG